MRDYQIGIIGGGVIGSAVAWELSGYKVDVAVFEAGSDVASGTSKANSGVVHSGINSAPRSLKARFCVEGNQMFDSLSEELGFPLEWVGKFVIAKDDDEIKELERLKSIGIQNGVPGLEIIEGAEVNRKERSIICRAGLWVPTAGITLPYKFTIALAENSVLNGVRFFLEARVTALRKAGDHFVITTNKGEFRARCLINAAGVACRDIVSMLEEPDFHVYPCRGEYLVLDKNCSSLVHSMIYPIPDKELGVLGVHITPTIDGNILLGPSAEFIDDPLNKGTTRKTMTDLLREAKAIMPSLPEKGVINAYSGIRCKLAPPEEGGWADFRIEESKQTPGLINLLGIESPGLTGAPAIAKEVVRLLSKTDTLEAKPRGERKIREPRGKRFPEMSMEERSALIKEDERWGRVVCRCEHVTEAEVMKALSGPLGARPLSSVKYRCRAGAGRCQGGFCTQHIVRIMQEEFGTSVEDIKLKSPESRLFYRRTREGPE